MAEITKRPTPVHVVGVDERSKSALILFFQTLGDKSCELVDASSAELFLINMDASGADADYVRLYKNYPNHPMILMSMAPRETSGHFFLRKPIIADHLLAILEEIEKKRAEPKIHRNPTDRPTHSPAVQQATTRGVNQVLEREAQLQTGTAGRNELKTTANRRSFGYAAHLLSEQEVLCCVGAAKDIDSQNPEAVVKAHFDPAHYLIGHIQQACREALEKQQCIQITGLWRSITVLPSSQEVYVRLSDRQLQSICVVTTDNLEGNIEIQPAKKEQIPSPEEKKYFQGIELFLWKVALWTSRGRVPVEIQLDQPVYLRGWPNQTRLTLTPQGLRIAACWIRQPRSLIDLATVLKIPQRYVFSFFSACYITGLAGPARRASDLIVVPPKLEPSSSVGLLSRILKSLIN